MLGDLAPRVSWIQSSIADHIGYGKAATLLHTALVKAGMYSCGWRDQDWDARVVFSGPRAWMFPPNSKEIVPDLMWHTMFEAHPVPQNWVTLLNLCQAIWVPAQWNKQIFEESGVKRPILVSGYGVDTQVIYDHDVVRSDRPYTFLWCGHSMGDGRFGDRKGGELVLKAYMKLKLPNAKLVLKAIESSAIREIKVNGQLRDDIVLLAQRLTEEEYVQLHLQADCFVYPSHGEGFGLQPMEAMGLGLPVIMPAYSGMVEFAKPGIYVDLPVASEGPSTLYNKIYDEKGMVWAQYNVDDLCDRMKWCYDHRDEARNIGKDAAQYIAQEWSWGQAGERGLALIRDFCEGRYNG